MSADTTFRVGPHRTEKTTQLPGTGSTVPPATPPVVIGHLCTSPGQHRASTRCSHREAREAMAAGRPQGLRAPQRAWGLCLTWTTPSAKQRRTGPGLPRPLPSSADSSSHVSWDEGRVSPRAACCGNLLRRQLCTASRCAGRWWLPPRCHQAGRCPSFPGVTGTQRSICR